MYGPAEDGSIPGMDISLKDSDTLSFGGANAQVIDVGGHTVGGWFFRCHICNPRRS